MSRKAKPRHADPSPVAPRRRLRGVFAAVGLLAVLALGWFLWGWLAAPAPPAVSVADADPAVAAAIAAARREVWWKPHSAAAWGRLGQLLRAHGHVADSNRCFTQAERLDPADPRWPYLQGISLLSDDPAAAIDHLRRAVAVCGSVPDAPRLGLAEACFRQGGLAEAERHFQEVLRRDPANARAHLGLGRLAGTRGRWADSIAHLDRAAASRLTPKAASILLAQAHHQLKDAAAAARARARAVELPADPPWPDPFQEEILSLMAGKQARLARLQTLHRQGRDADARALARELEADYPDVYWLVEGRGQLARGDAAAAERALRKAVQLAPQSVDALFDLGAVLFEQGDDRGAADCFARVTDLEPSYGPAYQRLGRCRLRQGDRAAARQAFQAAVRYMPQNAEARRELGAALAQEGQPARAMEELRHALRLQPDDVKARELLDALTRRKP